GIPEPVPTDLGEVKISCCFDTIGETIGELVCVTPHALAGEFTTPCSIVACVVSVGYHTIKHLQLNHAAGQRRIWINLELPRIHLGGNPTRQGGQSQYQTRE